MKLMEVAQNQMENILKTDNMVVILAGAALSPALNALYGERGTDMMIIVIAVLLLDLIVGTLAAKKEKIETSEHGLKGLIRIAVISFLPVIAHRADLFVGFGDFMFFGISIGILYHTLKSFGANVVRVGWDKYIPLWVIDVIIGFLETEIQSKMARSQAQFEKLYGADASQPLSNSLERRLKTEPEVSPITEAVAIDIEPVKG
ncbi:hypothetical protein C0431_12340 [bacterium]|nr:hypothetical protein [bacterium]